MKPTVKSFYERPAWKSLRYRVLTKFGARCLLCGRGKEDGVAIHIDHIHPVSIYPELALTEDNLQVLCADCNLGKSNTDIQDFRPKLKVVRPVVCERLGAIEEIISKLKTNAALCGEIGDDVGAAEAIRKLVQIRHETSKPGLTGPERVATARRLSEGPIKAEVENG